MTAESTSITKDDGAAWDECPTGEISRMVSGVRSAKRRAMASKIGAIAAYSVIICGVLFTAIYFNAQAKKNFGDLTCSQVVDMLPEYGAGKLDEDLTARVKEHLVHCAACKQHHDELQANQNNNSVVAMVERLSQP